MKRSTQRWVGVIALLSFAPLFFHQSRAWALPAPPSGDPYAPHWQPINAFNTFQVSDPQLANVEHVRTATIGSNYQATAVEITAYGDTTWYDYYVSFPRTLPDQSTDNSYFEYDYNDQTGEYAGFMEVASWDNGDGTWYYFIDMQQNGSYHWIGYSLDQNGNVIESTAEEAKYQGRVDRCKVISDWGESMCPAKWNGIQEIPTQIRSRIAKVGWLTDWAKNDKVRTFFNNAVQILSDPKVVFILASAAAISTIIACCWGTLGTACYWCGVAAFSGLAIAAGSFAYQMQSCGCPVITNTSNLRSAGIIACDNPDCGTRIAADTGGPPIGCGIAENAANQVVGFICLYQVPYGTACIAGFQGSPPGLVSGKVTCAYSRRF
jgi:hypothetical protein